MVMSSKKKKKTQMVKSKFFSQAMPLTYARIEAGWSRAGRAQCEEARAEVQGGGGGSGWGSRAHG